MSRRVSPTEQIRDEIDALFTDDRDLVDVLEEVARLGARLIIQTALEVEVTEFLGRPATSGRRAPRMPARDAATATVRPR